MSKARKVVKRPKPIRASFQIARSLAIDPEIILLDKPIPALDPFSPLGLSERQDSCFEMKLRHILELAYDIIGFDIDLKKGTGGRCHKFDQIGMLSEIELDKTIPVRRLDFLDDTCSRCRHRPMKILLPVRPIIDHHRYPRILLEIAVLPCGSGCGKQKMFQIICRRKGY